MQRGVVVIVEEPAPLVRAVLLKRRFHLVVVGLLHYALCSFSEVNAGPLRRCPEPLLLGISLESVVCGYRDSIQGDL